MVATLDGDHFRLTLDGDVVLGRELIDQYCDMLAASDGPRTSIVTDSA
jgi:hypothetical protein